MRTGMAIVVVVMLGCVACGSSDSSQAPIDSVAGGDGGVGDGGGGGGGSCTADTRSDPANCGACGHDCLGGTCSNGTCGPVVLAEDVGLANNDIAVDETNVYFTTQVSPMDGLSSVPKDGSGSVRQLVHYLGVGSETFPGPFVLDKKYVYYQQGYEGTAGKLARIGKDGTDAKELSGSSGVSYLTVDPTDTHLYVGCSQYIPVWDLPAATKAPQLNGPAELAQSVVGCVMDPDGAMYDLLDAQTGQSSVAQLRLDTAQRSIAVKILGTLAAARVRLNMATDADYAYVVDASNGIQRAAKDGSGVSLVATDDKSPSGSYGMTGRPLVDDKYVYWSIAEHTPDMKPLGAKLQRAPKAGGNVEVLIDSDELLSLGAMDDERLYLTAGSDNYHQSIIAIAR